MGNKSQPGMGNKSQPGMGNKSQPGMTKKQAVNEGKHRMSQPPRH